MIIRTGLCGDLHTNVAKRAEEARRIAYWIVDDAVAKGAHFLGIGGDGIDGPMTEKDRAWLIEFSDYCGNRLPTLWIMGNHEPVLSLRCLRGRQTKYPVIVEEGADVHVIDTKAGQLAVAAVSFPIKANLLAQVGRPVSGEEADAIAGQALQDVFRGLGLRVDQLGLPAVGLVHGTIKGSKISDDQPDRPLGLDIDVADLALMHCDFICAPHIHKTNEFTFNGITAATPSSPLYLDYGEAKHFKGYILAEFDTDIVNVTPGDCAKWSRIPTPATPMLLAEYEWNGEMFIRDGNQLHESDLDPLGADIRFRFRFAADQRAAAVEAANGIAGLWRVDGAANVTLDPVQIPTTRARIPALTSTVRLEDKLKLYWQSIGFSPTPERSAALIEMLHDLQDAAAAQGLSMGTTGRTAPALHKFKGKGLLKFPNEFALDFTAMAGPLTAIIAPNEEGKTLLMQLAGPGLLYSTTPTRGTIDDLAIDNGAYIEGEFSMNGAEYKLTQVASTKSRTGRTSYPGTVSLLKNGVAELGNKSAGGRDEYKKWADKNLLPQNVYDAVICQSGTESVIEMKDGPRVELLLRVLGLEIYEALAKMARDRAAAVTEELSGVRARIEEIGEANLQALQSDYAGAVVSKTEAEATLSFAERTLAEAREQKDDIDKRRANHATLVSRLAELAAQVTATRTKRTQVQTKIEVGQELTGQRAAIEKAAADSAALEAEVAGLPTHTLQVELTKAQAAELHIMGDKVSLEKRIEELTARDAQLDVRLASFQAQIAETQATVADGDAIRAAVTETANWQSALKNKREEDANQRVREAELAGQLRDVRAQINSSLQKASELVSRKESLEAIVATKEFAQSAVDELAETEADILRAEIEMSRYREEVESLQREIATSKDTRITGLFTGHSDIANGLAEPVARSRKAMDDDLDLAAEEEDNPARVESAKKEAANCEAALREFRSAVKRLEPTAQSLQQIRDAETSLIALTAEIEETDIRHHGLVKESEAVTATQGELGAQMRQTQSDIRWLNEQIEGLAPLVGRAEALATADTKLQSLREQMTIANEDQNKIALSLVALQKELDEFRMAADDAALRTESLQAKITANDAAIAELRSRIEALFPWANKSSFLTAAIAAEETLLHQLSQVDEELEALEHKHDQLEHQVDEGDKTLPEPVDLANNETMVTRARGALSVVQTELAIAERALKDAEARESRRQTLTAQVRGLEEQVSNWTALGQHLGKDGLQKEEVSAAGPQLTEITNNLLRTAGDTRHTVSIETERLHSNKKQMIPCLDIMVFDSVEQISKESRRLSDAGKVLVGEPFSLALVVLGCQRAGIKSPTIFRDEATGVMDVANSGFYIGMLRGFAEMLDAHVLFISQNPAMWDLADSRVFIEAGKLRLE